MENIEQLKSIVYDKEILTSLKIEITSKCNWNCEHCYVSYRESDKFNIENLTLLFHQFRRNGIFELYFIGGEVFVKKDMMEVIELARKMFFKVTIESNISLLDEEKIKKLSELNISEIRCTVFSLDEQIHDDITGVQGSLKSVINNLKLLKKYRINTTINNPIMKKNKYDFKDLNEFCKKNGFSFNCTASLVHKRNGDDCKEYSLTSEEIKEIIADIDKINTNYFGIRNMEDYVCPHTRMSMYIDSQGEVYPCVNYRQSLGNIFLDNIDDIFKNEHRKKIANLKYKDLVDCNDCKYKNKCIPCPGCAHMETGNILKCATRSLNSAMGRC